LVFLRRNLKLSGSDGHAISAAKQMFQITGGFIGKDVSQAGSYRGPAVGPEHPSKSNVAVSHSPIGSQGKYAGRNALEDGFDVASSLLEFSVCGCQCTGRLFNFAAARFQFGRHAVE